MPLLFFRQEDELVPELDDNPGTTGGTTFSVLLKKSSLVWSTVVFDCPLIGVSVFFAEFSK